MSDNEVMTTSVTGGTKAGNDERYDLLPATPLRELARHYGIGSRKYESRNWERGYDWHLSFAALNRHLWAFWHGEDFDSPTGTKHIIAVAWHALALAEFMETHPEFDDRPSTQAKRRSATQTPFATGGLIHSGVVTSPNWQTLLNNVAGALECKPDPLAKPYPVVVDKLTADHQFWNWKGADLIYTFVDGQWWWMQEDDQAEDPWEISDTESDGITVPQSLGPFERYEGKL